MSDAHEKAREFLDHQKAFRLGELLTESSHPKTRQLSQVIQTDLQAGVRLLQAVDEDIPAALARIFAQDTFGRLVEALREAMRGGRRIFFTGCGATGRLSILLEAAWRRFWRESGLGVPPSGGSESPPAQPAPHPVARKGKGTSDCLTRVNAVLQTNSSSAGPGGALVAEKVECPLFPPDRMEDRCLSVMAGGDFALIKSVEGFEDFPDFGRHQLREAGVQRDDVVVAITEGGETPFVIGTAWQGLETGAHVFFVYNNPTDLLRRHVQRSREVIEERRIHKLDLATGAMAITGSTRMQATTTELLVVGAALEMALAQTMEWSVPTTAHYEQFFAQLLAQLSSPPAVAAIARMVELEEQVYRRHGLVTYLADSLLLDILTDTTERAPTFMLPPFRKEGDTVAPVSWAFVKSPHHPTRQAWADMLQREPRGLTWGPDVYRQLNAPLSLQANPPKLDNAEIHKFRIGNESDPSRTSAPDSLVVVVNAEGKRGHSTFSSSAGPVGTLAAEKVECPLFPPGNQESGAQYRKTVALTFGPPAISLEVDGHIHIPCDLPASPLRLWEHLAVKLILNTLSTATMVRMGRVIGNAMVWVSPSNKKLIDRGCRLIVQQTGCTYEHACAKLHEAMEEIARRSRAGEEVPSPVALAIERLGATGREEPI